MAGGDDGEAGEGKDEAWYGCGRLDLDGLGTGGTLLERRSSRSLRLESPRSLRAVVVVGTCGMLLRCESASALERRWWL